MNKDVKHIIIAIVISVALVLVADYIFRAWWLSTVFENVSTR